MNVSVLQLALRGTSSKTKTYLSHTCKRVVLMNVSRILSAWDIQAKTNVSLEVVKNEERTQYKPNDRLISRHV